MRERVTEGLPTKEAIERLEHPEAAKVRAYPATGFLLDVNREARSPVDFDEVGATDEGKVNR